MTWEYIAGFFDGEGNINIRNTSGTCLRISQSEKSADVLYLIQSFLLESDIKSYMHRLEPSNIGTGPVLALNITDSRCIQSFLVRVIPYLVVKKEKAWAAMQKAMLVIDRQNDTMDRVQLAINAVADGMTVSAASRKYHIGHKRLKGLNPK